MQNKSYNKGRLFGVPGIASGSPGWAGNAGVSQISHPSRRSGPSAVKTYGSLGYASMGDGSMDMAVRGVRFSMTHKSKKKHVTNSTKRAKPKASRKSILK